ncbi:hypothetical protein ACFL1R_04020 [Candidatus Latescibacterota bacterium]
MTILDNTIITDIKSGYEIFLMSIGCEVYYSWWAAITSLEEYSLYYLKRPELREIISLTFPQAVALEK